MRFKLEKLIRDLLPQVMNERGVLLKQRTLNPEEFVDQLKIKLIEEANEVANAKSRPELIEELADVFEVLQALAKTMGITSNQIEEIQLKKLADKGGFDSKIFAEHVDIDEKNPAIQYFLANPAYHSTPSKSE